MSIFETSDRPRELCPEGRHTAYLYSVVDLGSIRDSYQGEEKIRHQIYLTWEFPEAPMSDGRPFVHGASYNVTDGNYGLYFAKTSNINKMLRGWTGLDEKACSKPGLLGKLVRERTPCTISIVHEEGKKDKTKTYAVAESIKPCKAKDLPAPVNPHVFYGPVGSEIPDAIPEWLKKRIGECLELNGGVPKREDRPAPGAGMEEGDMDIPF